MDYGLKLEMASGSAAPPRTPAARRADFERQLEEKEKELKDGREGPKANRREQVEWAAQRKVLEDQIAEFKEQRDRPAPPSSSGAPCTGLYATRPCFSPTWLANMDTVGCVRERARAHVRMSRYHCARHCRDRRRPAARQAQDAAVPYNVMSLGRGAWGVGRGRQAS